VLLAAHALGLGAIWRTGPMAYRAEINAFLGLEADDRIVGFVYVGRPGMAPPTPQPRDVDAYLRFLD
jgi:nitroreductase